MNIIFLILLGTVIVAATAFLLLLFKLPLEDADLWLKALSGVVAAFTFIAGVSALVTGHIVNNRQAEKVLILEKETADAKRSYLELQERLKDRHLTPEQRTKLIELLRASPKGTLTVWYVSNDSEAKAFALELADAIEEAGWTVDLDQVGAVLGAGTGVHLEVSDVENPAAGALQPALNTVGIPADGIYNRTMANPIRLTVGAKP